ncbi:hypothetical protein [Pseudomonas koreensis]|uniref:Uncharacterized protein n=1 Tax=Pseudomonas koreensis TaxID=198620 RepID=A0A9X3BFN8_9PSED|nr:hypothetical protein [Pseudomonas koreensis]MCU7251614.1 hypothetical protein [Pseudomonas koreensis]
MKLKKTTVGDIVLIPVDKGFKPAKVLYVSDRYKDTILLGIYKNLITEQKLPEALPDTFGLLLYTSKVPIQRQRWHHVGHEDLRVSQTDLDLRLVAGELWKGDVHMGAASDEDRKNLPEMLVMGAGLVEKKAAALT